MIFQRGNPLDYERWAADPGMERWSYAHCLPYFKRMETCLAGADAWRGGDGPLKLERGPATNPLFEAFFSAAEQAGYWRTDDVNGYRQEGFARFDRNIYRGRRYSAARAYLHPVMRSTEPHGTHAGVRQAHRVRWHSARSASNARTTRACRRRSVRARSSCAAVRSTRRSCCNCPAWVRRTCCSRSASPPVADLPGVGANLQDHLEVYVQFACRQPVAVNPHISWLRKLGVGAQWLFGRSGIGATNHFEGGGFCRSNDDVDYPNLMFHFLPMAIRYDGTSPTEGLGYQVHVGPMYSDARGSVQIRSTDPRQAPALQFNYLSTDQDRREWVEAIRVARRILNQPALAEFSGGEISPGPGVESDEEILDWVRRDAETALHPTCTAKMGTGADAVLDPGSMRVHGLDGLRVVDASAFPVRAQRQHLCADDDGRGEERRPDPRQHAAACGNDTLFQAA